MAVQSIADFRLLKGLLPVISIQSIWLFHSHILDFLTVDLEDQVSVFMSRGNWVAQLYPQAPSTHFSRLLWQAWATVRLFFSPVTTRGNYLNYGFKYNVLQTYEYFQTPCA
jgi:hypothetical protein